MNDGGFGVNMKVMIPLLMMFLSGLAFFRGPANNNAQLIFRASIFVIGLILLIVLNLPKRHSDDE